MSHGLHVMQSSASQIALKHSASPLLVVCLSLTCSQLVWSLAVCNGNQCFASLQGGTWLCGGIWYMTSNNEPADPYVNSISWEYLEPWQASSGTNPYVAYVFIYQCTSLNTSTLPAHLAGI